MNGTGKEISVGVIRIIQETNSTISIRACGCDGTSCNTSPNCGALRYIEIHPDINRPLQHIICVLHFIESPFK